MNQLRAVESAGARNGATDALHVEGIAKHFGGLRVFEDISFTVPAGEVLGVIGPNGAGKTTMINVMCGMLTPSAGRVKLGNHDITGKPFHAISRLGVVRSFQQTNTFRSASVEENLFRAERFSAANGGPDLALSGLLEEFGLSRHMDEPSDKLPYGLQKMLGLVMVLAARPRFLLLDEPVAGLERRERTQLDRFVEHARQKLGCGVLIVEHDMDLVRRLCPQVVVLESGRLLAAGAPEEVLSRRDVIDAYLGASED
ncbi:ABC transporter ATP-binding protein [Burkholderia diffusa]|uniref:ABC transporter ATP-binding protein n=1 Tax=Burkholderia diffusa TaxID=488732 RepID=A0AAW3PBG1_9BURK|nr:ABC transporter ATP-binding protein [Burkholderia diffusa]KWF32836.1 ABC transporter ATP-binding protein [Burkholderia diffusa]KWF38761.1 ABC transporter ATP-binding protein [Burkholderia diffusa]KWF46806.1 ABC transporter ATP-binding protein [Burkholderia diffusa]KWF50623.1 ABC transporter ATP-binding protein [Burkholderia diffusa]